MYCEELIPDSKLRVLRVKNRHCEGLVSPYGAHVLSYIPEGGREVLMVSRSSRFEAGQPIRGGVPVCWPWFGDAAEPMHGIARRQYWTFAGAATAADGGDTLSFTLEIDRPQRLAARFEVSFGAVLTMRLWSINRGDRDFVLSEALHTYFAVGDIARITVYGLEHTSWIDTVGDAFRSMPGESGALTFAGETDRIYASIAKVAIDDPVLKRRIIVSKHGSAETVVWNPWQDKAARMADFGDEEYHTMLCVEAGNMTGTILAPGQPHLLEQQIRVL